VSVVDDLALEEELARVPLRRTTWRRLLRYFGPHRKSLLLGLSIESFWVLVLIVETAMLRAAIDGPLTRGDARSTVLWCLAIAGSVAFRAWITVIELRRTQRAGVEALHAIRSDVFDHLQRLSMRYFDRTKQGRILARADRDVDSLEHVFTWGPVGLANNVTALLAALTRIVWVQPHLTLWVLGAMPVLWFLARGFQRVGFPAYRRIRETHSAISAHVAERITGVRVVKAFAAEARESATLERLQAAYRSATMAGARATAAFVPVLTLVIQGILVVALLLGAARVLDGELTPGALLEAVILLGFALTPIEGLAGLYNECLVAGAAAERIFLLLDTTPDVADREGAADPGRLAGEVEFRDVGFSYDPAGAGGRQLAGISFRAAPGERIALVGHTGAGKTSILQLLARFYEPQEGQILYDGRDARTVAGAALHRQLGIVLQENFLFGGSVLENLRFARPDLSEAAALAGFESLGCREILAGLPRGLSTEVGERGANLSEGERQIVCFVRAHVSDPAILILDEATSAVDTRTEALLLRALRALSARRTTFVIAHRLSTIRDADRILVLDHGRLVEQGTHAALLETGGTYARLYGEYAR
jgi:ATP-binding cassette subfamily B protein